MRVHTNSSYKCIMVDGEGLQFKTQNNVVIWYARHTIIVDSILSSRYLQLLKKKKKL